jgi:hypothetical protein
MMGRSVDRSYQEVLPALDLSYPFEGERWPTQNELNR